MLASLLNNLANLRMSAYGDPEGAESLHGQALEIRQGLNAAHPEDASYASDLITSHIKLDDINEGFRAMMGGEVARGVVVFD